MLNGHQVTIPNDLLAGSDVDTGDVLSYGISGGVDGGATVSLAGTYGTLTVTKATGAYTYTKNAASIEALDAGDNVSDVFTVTVDDGDAPLGTIGGNSLAALVDQAAHDVRYADRRQPLAVQPPDDVARTPQAAPDGLTDPPQTGI